MQPLIHIIERGMRFIRSNPQIIYTFILAILIPVAFIATGEQFLDIAKKNQDRLERGRIGAMQEVFGILTNGEEVSSTRIAESMRSLIEQNPTLRGMRIVTPDTHRNAYRIISSAVPAETGETFVVDETLLLLFSAARGQPDQSFATEIWVDGERLWRSVRLLNGTSSILFLVSDVSMVQADREAARAIRNAYLTLIPVIALILVLLARHAKIIDYAALYQRLAEVDRMKDDFISMAAHELRAPLTVIRGYVDVLRSAPSEEREKYLQRIDASAAQLNTLIGDILDVARLQEGQMVFALRQMDPSGIIVEVVNSFMHQAREKGLTLTFDVHSLPEISIDPDRFRQVMTNLVGNAVKYTEKGTVQVRAESDGVEVVIRVSDTGIGISAQDQARLFSKFYRVKTPRTQGIPGTGLGLWITKTIVEEMRGTIVVESIEGKGTDFILRFPIPERS
jgi:signal transduction histidine kinase